MQRCDGIHGHHVDRGSALNELLQLGGLAERRCLVHLCSLRPAACRGARQEELEPHLIYSSCSAGVSQFACCLCNTYTLADPGLNAETNTPGQTWTSLDKPGQAWTSLDKPGVSLGILNDCLQKSTCCKSCLISSNSHFKTSHSFTSTASKILCERFQQFLLEKYQI